MNGYKIIQLLHSNGTLHKNVYIPSFTRPPKIVFDTHLAFECQYVLPANSEQEVVAVYAAVASLNYDNFPACTAHVSILPLAPAPTISTSNTTPTNQDIEDLKKDIKRLARQAITATPVGPVDLLQARLEALERLLKEKGYIAGPELRLFHYGELKELKEELANKTA